MEEKLEPQKYDEKTYLEAKKIVDAYERNHNVQPKQLKAVYLKCHHGIEKGSFIPCEKCEKERSDMFKGFSSSILSEVKKDTRIPIYRGCGVGIGAQCFCSGKCKEIIGYYE